MTYEDILDLLPIVAHQWWYITPYGLVRNAKGQCPVCALVGAIDPQLDYFTSLARTAMEAVLPLGVDSKAAVLAVMDAADHDYDDNRPELLAALGL